MWFGPDVLSPNATVVSVSGSLHRLPQSALQPGATVTEHDVVRTGAASRAVLQLADGSRVEMNQRTELSRAAEQWLYCRRWTKMGVGLLHHLYNHRPGNVRDEMSYPCPRISPGAQVVGDTISTTRPAA